MRKRTTLAWAAGLGILAFFGCDTQPEIPANDGGAGGLGAATGGGIGLGEAGQTGQGGAKDCGGQEVSAAPAVVNVLLVIDKSGSMNTTPDGFTNSKWDTMVSSLGVALGEVKSDLNFGLKLFPDGDTGVDQCAMETGVTIPIEKGTTGVPKINDALDAVGTGSGQTPTASALEAALDYFTSGDGKDLAGTNYVLLATDGGPNCDDAETSCLRPNACDPFNSPNKACTDAAATCTLNIDDQCGGPCPSGSVCEEGTQCLDADGPLAQVQALDAAGIKTIVLGMPGSESYQDILDALAVAGKLPASSTSPKYNKVTDAAGLTATLKDITRTVIRNCDIVLDEVPPDLGKVNVFLDGEVVPKSNDDGWKYDTSTVPPTIVLTGPTCVDVETQGVSGISVEFGCPTITVR